MNATHDTPASLAPSGPRAKRNRIWLLDAALAVQVAAWIVAVLTASNFRSAFGQAHPGLHATLVIGGAIWLSQFALVVVVVAHVRSRRQFS
jgi:hypothetical protein